MIKILLSYNPILSNFNIFDFIILLRKMYKFCLYAGIVFSLLILFSNSYQPIMASDSDSSTIKNHVSEKENKKMNTESILNELITKIKNKNDDCDCDYHNSPIEKHLILIVTSYLNFLSINVKY